MAANGSERLQGARELGLLSGPMALAPIEDILEDLKAGRVVVLVDDERRENEQRGDEDVGVFEKELRQSLAQAKDLNELPGVGGWMVRTRQSVAEPAGCQLVNWGAEPHHHAANTASQDVAPHERVAKPSIQQAHP